MKLVSYTQSIIAELRKVSWPSVKTVGRYFLSVVIGVGLATAVIAGFDYVFIHALGLIIK